MKIEWLFPKECLGLDCAKLFAPRTPIKVRRLFEKCDLCEHGGLAKDSDPKASRYPSLPLISSSSQARPLSVFLDGLVHLKITQMMKKRSCERRSETGGLKARPTFANFPLLVVIQRAKVWMHQRRFYLRVNVNSERISCQRARADSLQ